MLNFTPYFNLYKAYRNRLLRLTEYSSLQSRVLFALLKKAEKTRFGQEHGFNRLRSVTDYQSAVPLRSYEKFWNEYWKESYPHLENCTWPGLIPFFCLSSGTSSGTTKYIPYSWEIVRANNKAGMDLLVHHLNNCPKSQILGGHSFMLGGSTDLRDEGDGIKSGDMSGIAVITMPTWAKQRYYPPPSLALLKNWEEKIDKLSRGSLDADIRMISGVPSWLLIFFKRLAELRPAAKGKLKEIYPNLEMLVHGGVNFAPYYEQFKDLLEGSRAELREVYPASEGFIAVADRGYGEGLRLNLDHGLFLEFVPVEELDAERPTRHWVQNVEIGVNYAVVLTTCAGLWSYIIGDTVKFIDLSPPRILVSGRVSYYLSAFGEHVISDEVDKSVVYAAEQLKVQVSDYTVAPVYPSNPGELGGHIYLIEVSSGKPDGIESSFSKFIDEKLSRLNEDYEAHRANGFGLKPPIIKILPEGTFASWMKNRGKLGGQNKVPRIITDPKLLSELMEFAKIR